jgi:hypothetical protein
VSAGLARAGGLAVAVVLLGRVVAVLLDVGLAALAGLVDDRRIDNPNGALRTTCTGQAVHLRISGTAGMSPSSPSGASWDNSL